MQVQREKKTQVKRRLEMCKTCTMHMWTQAQCTVCKVTLHMTLRLVHIVSFILTCLSMYEL